MRTRFARRAGGKPAKPLRLNAFQVEKMRAAGQLAAELLDLVEAFVRPGVSTADIDDLVAEETRKRGAVSAPLGYKGFPRHCCTSVNEVVCHGIPSPTERLREGSIVNVDVTPVVDGFHGDSSRTFCVGEVSARARRLVEDTHHCLLLGIAAVRPGGTVGDIGHAIQTFAEGRGYSVVRDFTGHGIGRVFHTSPTVPHYGEPGTGERLRPGMVFTIEPMINAGAFAVRVLDDGWTAVTVDGSLSAQFEHTVAVTDEGVDVLTLRPGEQLALPAA